MRFLTLSSLFIVIFSKESGIKKFHLVKLLQDYDITDEPYFNSRKRSLVSCAGQCIDTKSCVSVFYSASSCKGFKFVHPLNHTSLTKMVGTKYYVAYSTSNQHKSINYFGLYFFNLIFENIESWLKNVLSKFYIGIFSTYYNLKDWWKLFERLHWLGFNKMVWIKKLLINIYK